MLCCRPATGVARRSPAARIVLQLLLPPSILLPANRGEPNHRLAPEGDEFSRMNVFFVKICLFFIKNSFFIDFLICFFLKYSYIN